MAVHVDQLLAASGGTGRRCEAKLALPRGGANPNRTTRIFVARILPTVTDEAFRAHFEQYGTVQVCSASAMLL